MLTRVRRSGSRFVQFIADLSAGELFSSWALITIGFAVAYYFLADFPGQGPGPLLSIEPIWRFLETLYFSVIVGTTTGLGDIVPHGFSRVLTMAQSISSFILLAAFVAKFAAQKQERVLDDIHQLAFDSSFHTIRNGLFIARKDIDVLIKGVLSSGELTKKDLLNLKTALRQMQIFIKHIPDFYSKTVKTHMFDVDRELLLIDSLERTMTRIVEALVLFKARNINAVQHENIVKEFRSLIQQIENMSLHEEKKTLDPENHEALQEILSRTEDIRAHLKELE